jgi:hypothetical protein
MFNKINKMMADVYSEKATLAVLEDGERIIDFDAMQKERVKYEFVLPVLVGGALAGIMILIHKKIKKHQ